MNIINSSVASIIQKLFDGTLVPGLDLIRKIGLVVQVRGTIDYEKGLLTDYGELYIVNALVSQISLEDVARIKSPFSNDPIESGDLRVSIGRQQTGIPPQLTTDAMVLLKQYGSDVKTKSPKAIIFDNVMTVDEPQLNIFPGDLITYDKGKTCCIKKINSNVEYVVISEQGEDVEDEDEPVDIESIQNDAYYKIVSLVDKRLGSTVLLWDLIVKRR